MAQGLSRRWAVVTGAGTGSPGHSRNGCCPAPRGAGGHGTGKRPERRGGGGGRAAQSGGDESARGARPGTARRGAVGSGAMAWPRGAGSTEASGGAGVGEKQHGGCGSEVRRGVRHGATVHEREEQRAGLGPCTDAVGRGGWRPTGGEGRRGVSPTVAGKWQWARGGRRGRGDELGGGSMRERTAAVVVHGDDERVRPGDEGTMERRRG
nr:protein argonaute 18-like [Aegilops tauschii subsp. strangulata]